MADNAKCRAHSGVCEMVDNVVKQTDNQWKAIKEINNKLWMILFVAAVGAIGTLVNLVVKTGVK